MAPNEVEVRYIGRKERVSFSFPWDPSGQTYTFRTGQQKFIPAGVAKRIVEEGPKAFEYVAPTREQRKALPEEKFSVPRETFVANQEEDSAPIEIDVDKTGELDESEGEKLLDEEKDRKDVKPKNKGGRPPKRGKFDR